MIPDLNITVRSNYLLNASEIEKPIDTIFFLLLETQLVDHQDKIWSELSSDDQCTLDKLFSYAVAERYRIRTGFVIDPSSHIIQAGSLKIQLEKKLKNEKRDKKSPQTVKTEGFPSKETEPKVEEYYKDTTHNETVKEKHDDTRNIEQLTPIDKLNKCDDIAEENTTIKKANKKPK